MSLSSSLRKIKLGTGLCLALGLPTLQTLFPPASEASQRGDSLPNVPRIFYVAESRNPRALIFVNNPEFLWASRGACDLADDTHPFNQDSCRTSLFRVDTLRQGQYRAWWEHRNMMPFAIRSNLLLTNNTSKLAIVNIEGVALETNSAQRGGQEFVAMFNTPLAIKRLSINPGERLLLSEISKKWIHPSHFFAGFVDFTVVEGEVSLDKIVFRNRPAETLRALPYTQRNIWGVQESLVYKGIAQTSEVLLQGAEFHVDDETPLGPLPVSYEHSFPQGNPVEAGYCDPARSPPCAGRSLIKQSSPTQQTFWVTHIAPDPRDANPKRKFAIVDDLVELLLPGSTASCPSAWPMSENLGERSCVRMSAHFHWFLDEFRQWRLPNWGNWAVQYKHPIRVANSGTRNRTVVLKVTADGSSPLAFRGTGISPSWQQVFLDPRAKKKAGQSSVVIAQATISPHTTLDLQAELILSGPGAGTLKHQVEIID